MRSIGLACCLVCATVPFAAAQEARPAAGETETAFWRAPRVELDLRSLAPAPVELVAGPDRTRDFALLQIGDVVPSPDVKIGAAYMPNDDTGYRLVPGGLKVGALPYGDRTYKITKLDAPFAGLPLLQTKNGHKSVLDGRFSVVVAAAQPCLVFVALSQGCLETYKEHGTPAWLQEFAPTGHKLATDNASYLVFVKKAAAGRIAFGPPCSSSSSMYFAFFATDKQEEPTRRTIE
jgi:hypothetical protein